MEEYHYECEDCDIEFSVKVPSGKHGYLVGNPVCPLCARGDDIKHLDEK